MNKTFTLVGAIFICFGILTGAFGAHGLRDALTLEELDSFEVGVRYQMYHGIAMLILGLNAKKITLNSFILWGFTLGTILFSLSIYFLSTDRAIGIDLTFLGPMTPIGGAVLIITWIYIINQIARSN